MIEKDRTQRETHSGNVAERKVLFFRRELEALQLWIWIQL